VIRKRSLFSLLFFALSATLTSSAADVDQPKVDRIVVLKKEHRMLLLSGDSVVRSYRVALGRGGIGPKERRGDGRTPEGTYRIDSRNPASKYYRALHISYPDRSDAERARRMGLSPGGDIEIHGVGARYDWITPDKHRMTDWTEGCIAVTNREIDEIWSLVPDGTPVEVRRSSEYSQLALRRTAQH
jgi:murein L,D-transpeptidase YafK